MSESYFLEAEEALQRAKILYEVTYKTLNDPKLFLSIINALEEAIVKKIKGFVYKQTAIEPKSLNSIVTFFKENCLIEYRIQPRIILVLEKIRSFQQAKKESPIEFRRKDKYIVCEENYKMKVIDENIIKAWLETVTSFLEQKYV
jgi:hypothetical protein